MNWADEGQTDAQIAAAVGVSYKTIANASGIHCQPSKLIFEHDGAPFTSDELAALLTGGSSKEFESEVTTGRFGTGYLVTHVLAERAKRRECSWSLLIFWESLLPKLCNSRAQLRVSHGYLYGGVELGGYILRCPFGHPETGPT
jgi:hypothetical protein